MAQSMENWKMQSLKTEMIFQKWINICKAVWQYLVYDLTTPIDKHA